MPRQLARGSNKVPSGVLFGGASDKRPAHFVHHKQVVNPRT